MAFGFVFVVVRMIDGRESLLVVAYRNCCDAILRCYESFDFGVVVIVCVWFSLFFWFSCRLSLVGWLGFFVFCFCVCLCVVWCEEDKINAIIV